MFVKLSAPECDMIILSYLDFFCCANPDSPILTKWYTGATCILPLHRVFVMSQKLCKQCQYDPLYSSCSDFPWGNVMNIPLSHRDLQHANFPHRMQHKVHCWHGIGAGKLGYNWAP